MKDNLRLKGIQRESTYYKITTKINKALLNEKTVKDIIKQKTKYTDDNNKLNLIIYHKGTNNSPNVSYNI